MLVADLQIADKLLGLENAIAVFVELGLRLKVLGLFIRVIVVICGVLGKR